VNQKAPFWGFADNIGEGRWFFKLYRRRSLRIYSILMPMRGHVPEWAARFGLGGGLVEADIPERLRIEPRELAALAMERK